MFANIGAIVINDFADIQIDSKSREQGKRSRPLVTGEISKKEAVILATIAFLLSLIVSLLYNEKATLFSVVIIFFSLTYSLPPTRFSATPYASVLYWIILCLSCYFLMINALASSGKELNDYFHYTPGWIFISGIILFMGIAEIMAKDLRDFENDREGGRNTYVNFVGVEISSRIMLFFSWFGFILWIEALYLSGRFPNSIPGFVCFIAGLVWCIQVSLKALKLSTAFDQSIAARLHQNWTYFYATMQILTYLSFIKK